MTVSGDENFPVRRAASGAESGRESSFGLLLAIAAVVLLIAWMRGHLSPDEPRTDVPAATQPAS